MQSSRRAGAEIATASLLVLVALWTTGCSALRTNCPACATPPPPASPMSICGTDAAKIRDEMAATVFDPLKTSNTDAPEMLFLSAGGSWGAWGAGVLYGWAEAGTRPAFEVVTGSSTGALLGVFAILGEACPTPGTSCVTAMDDKMKQVYTTSKNADIYHPRSLLSVPYSDSINTLGPLRHLVKTTFTPAVVQQVGQIYHDSGRQLWVGTTNLDTGEFCNWNLSKLAWLGEYDRFIDLLIASSANPGVFDPVIIDGALHADGGVRHQFFGGWVQGAVDAYSASRVGATVPTPDKPTAYAIVNGQMAVRRQCVTDHIATVVLRSSSILMNDALLGDLYQAKAKLDGALPKWDMFTTRVPADYVLWPSPDKFVPADMLDLFDKGRTVGGDMSKWTPGIPDAGVPETQCLPMF
jgi:predicted acylesterase/phospholipase RssA